MEQARIGIQAMRSTNRPSRVGRASGHTGISNRADSSTVRSGRWRPGAIREGRRRTGSAGIHAIDAGSDKFRDLDEVNRS